MRSAGCAREALDTTVHAANEPKTPQIHGPNATRENLSGDDRDSKHAGNKSHLPRSCNTEAECHGKRRLAIEGSIKSTSKRT